MGQLYFEPKFYHIQCIWNRLNRCLKNDKNIRKTNKKVKFSNWCTFFVSNVIEFFDMNIIIIMYAWVWVIFVFIKISNKCLKCSLLLNHKVWVWNRVKIWTFIDIIRNNFRNIKNLENYLRCISRYSRHNHFWLRVIFVIESNRK